MHFLSVGKAGQGSCLLMKCSYIRSIHLLFILAQEEGEEGDLRLTGSNTEQGGRLEIFLQNRWGTVCSFLFDQVDADVACRQLGFRSADNYNTTTRLG